MILTQTWAIGLLLNSHIVKHANCYGSSHYFLKILFINHTYKIQTKQGRSVAYPLAYKIWPGDLDLWLWKSIGFQILLRTKYVPSSIKIPLRMLILECSQGCYGRTDGRTDGSVTISLRNFDGEGIISCLPEETIQI